VRIKIEFETRNECLPIDYRRKFLSYLKSAIDEYNHDLYTALYGEGHNPKSFCLSIYFAPKVIISKDEIMLHSKRLHTTVTTRDMLLGIHLVNALMARVNKWFPLADSKNELKALSITKTQEVPITTNVVHFKILSPLVIRDHNEKEGKDWYLTFEDGDFKKVWKRNLTTELQNVFGRDVSSDVESLKIKPVHLKKTVVKSYGIYIPCTIGSLVLEGEIYLLEYLYKAGIGSRRALCFGCVDVV
jgi:CRISPR-associated endoribonuclease Cas6